MAYRDKRGAVHIPLDPSEPPLEFVWSRFSSLLADRERIAGQLAEVRTERQKMERVEIAEAQSKDRKALAERLRKGASPPPEKDQDKHERKAREALNTTTRREKALAEAAKMVEAELSALIDAQARSWLKEVERREEEASARLREACAELVEAHGEAIALWRLAAWLQAPDSFHKPLPPEVLSAVPTGRLQENGEPELLTVEEFVGMLLAHAHDRLRMRDEATLPAPLTQGANA